MRMRQLANHVSIASVLANGLVRSVYQPIINLSTYEIVAYEALARGPEGTNLENPDALFAAADRAGLRAELDWECRASALRGALAGEMGKETCLFINLEASSFRSQAPPHLAAELEAALPLLNVVAEITERDLVSDPAALVHQISGLRGLGFGIAVDDLGANPESMALLPFLEPDVIKLDMSLIQNSTSTEMASISAAVGADAERRGSVIIAEGIEHEEHFRRALVMGAAYGQGWLFARPGPFHSPDPSGSDAVRTSPFWDRLCRKFHPVPNTPWEAVKDSGNVQIATKQLLMPMSMNIEQHPISAFERPLVMAAFQHAHAFTPATATRYTELAREAAFVGVLGAGLGSEPARGVRGGTIDHNHPLAGEWTVVSVGPHYAAALIAHDMGDAGPQADRCFEYVITHDRNIAIAAATSLLRLIEPQTEPRRRSTDMP